MSDKTFQFELVSPAEKLVSAPAKSATVPGSEGEFGVLPGHASLISALKPGVVKFVNEAGGHEEIFIAGGFADVTADNLTILAEEAESVAALDREELEKQRAEINDDLRIVEGAADKARLQAKVDVIDAKLKYAA